ncbi:uncharacterized protein LOC100569007 [Acyrthosiphon pisum]|uniref:Uncharacterized protein n=1 Tax=Acyrthosiphon pisum TaxID=7029 RepID=A0A8R2H8T5_ACYPI|nr:uncharacterized protein LOC100569007 [Acyrthosiphon pisum]|eukprot:XP_016659370.1 PREDICTED: uncharacterized protein LOC100569007 [Acyrthosiphon pisum]
MTSNQLVVVGAAAVLWWSCASAATTDVSPGGQVASAANTAEGLPSLADISRIIEAQGLLLSSGTPFDLLEAWMTGDDGGDPAEGRGKKPKPAMMAMTMAGTAAASMLMMKAMAAIKLFIIHAFFATKLGLVVGAYLLVCKLMEMKSPAKKSVQVKWVSAPAHFDEHPPQMPPMISHYPDAGQSSYEPQQEQQQQQHQPTDQYGPPPQQQQYMSSGDFNGGGDMQAHYTYVSPVTYRPTMVNRNQSDNMAKSGRVKS